LIKQLDKGRIIGMKESGKSSQKISRITGHDGKTMPKIWNEYPQLTEQLRESETGVKAIQASRRGAKKQDYSEFLEVLLYPRNRKTFRKWHNQTRQRSKISDQKIFGRLWQKQVRRGICPICANLSRKCI